jgi:hypothetical protein
VLDKPFLEGSWILSVGAASCREGIVAESHSSKDGAS